MLVGAWETTFWYQAISIPLNWNGSVYWTTAQRALVTEMTPPIMSQRPAWRPGTRSPNVATMPWTLGTPSLAMIFCTVTGPWPLTEPSGLMMLAGASLARPMLMTPALRTFDSGLLPSFDPVDGVPLLASIRLTAGSARPAAPTVTI